MNARYWKLNPEALGDILGADATEAAEAVAKALRERPAELLVPVGYLWPDGRRRVYAVLPTGFMAVTLADCRACTPAFSDDYFDGNGDAHVGIAPDASTVDAATAIGKGMINLLSRNCLVWNFTKQAWVPISEITPQDNP